MLGRERANLKTNIGKIIVVIVIFSVAVAAIIGFITVTRSTKYMEAEIQEKILATSEKYANDFSAQFNHMEGLTDSLAAYVATTFDMNQYNKNPEQYMDQFEYGLQEVIQYDLQTIRNAHSLYVTFNPELTKVGREVWYIMTEDGPENIDVSTEQLDRDFTLPYDDDMAYFFEPQGKEHGVWIPLYLDQDINEEMFSYSRAIYIDNVFVGVAGADITAKDIVKTVEEMKLYSGGYAVLLDDEYNIIVGSEYVNDAEKKLISDSIRVSSENTSGVIEYENQDVEEIMAYSQMDNGWIMAVIQPRDSAYKSTYQLAKAFMLLAVVLAMVLIAFLYGFSRPFIRKQTTLEAENREKDLMLMYQSRQAKIGEMFANIAHQWKQPLNTINLIMANLLDSYRYNDLDEARLEKSVNKVANIVNKMSETITDFSGFLKPTKDKVFFDVNDCVKTAISLMEESINYHKIKVNVNASERGAVYGYYNEMVHAIFNILNNARDAIVLSNPENRAIEINTVGKTNAVEVQIRNYGETIPEEIMEQLFFPYFTTKESYGGTGLGLFISKQIVEDHLGGNIYMENLQDGVMCRIVIPEVIAKEVTHEDGRDDEIPENTIC